MDTARPLPRSMTLDEFTPLIGRAFHAECEPRSVALTLLEAVPIQHRALEGRPPFSLMFRSGPDVLLVPGSYVFRCGTFGPDLIHISPVLPRPGSVPGHHYQAVFD